MMRKRITLFSNAKSFVFCIVVLFSVVWICKVNAQTKVLLKANVDNVYVTPGGYAVFDLLKNDELGECNRNTIKLTVTQNPSHGTVIPIPATNNLYYIPTAGFTGQDKLEYRITCGGLSSDTIVNISVFEQPSNVMTDVCFVPRPETVWDIEKKAASSVLVHDLATPFVGDLDGDGISEVVVPGTGALSARPTAVMLVLNNDLTQKYSFTTPKLNDWGSMTHLIADVDNDGQGEIVVAATNGNSDVNDDFKLVCFTESGIRKWTSDAVYTTSVTTVSPIIGDIDNDGYSEILVGNNIYAGESGKLLVALPPGGRGFASGSPDNAGGGSRMPAFADLDGDGTLEVAAGNTTYKITITNRSGTTGNSAVVLAQIADIDGLTSIADIDSDGDLDVVVTGGVSVAPVGGRMYVWDGVTSARIGTPISSGSSSLRISRAFIGDITGSGNPEIVFTYPSGMSACYYDPDTNTLNKLWGYPTSDTSGATTMSMFDFNQDGISELVYRDETTLRLINGSMKSHKTGNDTIVYNLAEIPCYSATHTEYPIVVDFDRNGHADVLVSGDDKPYAAGVPRATRIVWFGSATANQWAPCRTVWNQHGFNPVYIDEKLVPVRYPVNPGASFYEKVTGKINRPFNNFLEQTTTLNEEGTPLYLGPDLYFDNQVTQKIYVDDVNDKLVITIGINNQGNADYEGNLRISTYVYDTETNPSTEYLIGSNNETVDIGIGQRTVITYEIPNYSTIMPAKYGYWEIRLNWEGNTYPIDQEECVYSNNINANLSLSQGEHVMCENDRERVYAFPQNTYWYKWYDDPASADPSHLVAEGDYCDVLKDASKLQSYYIETWDLATRTKLVSSIRDTVRVYLAPDSLIWTGLGEDMDWHNYENWFDPNDLSGLTSHSNIPRKCTDVLIPDMIANYSDLTPATLGGHTVYDHYAKSECANITFEHGGEVMRTDSLDYDAAYVRLTLNSNRWYMLSAPLQSLFPGDYYVTDPQPCEDDVFVYTRLYDKQNPETGKYVAGNWSGVFNSPDYSLPAGFGFSAWIDDKQPDVNIHTPANFFFPKHDSHYNMYSNPELCKILYTVPISRTDEHRFVYEPVLDQTTGTISLSASAQTTGTQVIVGNPFMAHWDFNQFQSLNASMIEPYYQVLDENGSFISYYITGGTTTGGLTRYIAPMQSVLVQSKTPFVELHTDARMTAVVPGDKLRSTVSSSSAELLSVKVSHNNISNKSLLYYHPDFIPDDYVDVPKAFLNTITEPVTVYTLSDEGDLLDIRNAESFDNPVFLGIRTSSTGDFEFRFEGIHKFASDYDIYLTDLGGDVPQQINLRVYPYYTFTKTSSDLFVSDRFYLTFVQKTTDIHSPQTASDTGIEFITRSGLIKVLSVDGSLLKNVAVYDLQGKLVATRKNIHSPQTEISVPKEGIYIIRASNGHVSKSVKIYCK